MDAISGTTLIYAIQTVVCPYARTDLFLTFFDDLAHDVRIGHVSTSHTDHVDLAGGDGVARGCDVGNLSRMERWETCRCANFASEIQMG
ncbi:hypothetical protein D3C76_975180 [compost metagenome]